MYYVGNLIFVSYDKFDLNYLFIKKGWICKGGIFFFLYLKLKFFGVVVYDVVVYWRYW